MSVATYLFTANIIVWTGIAGYVVFLASRSATLEKRVRQLELLGADNDES
ncbi:CcmD family protein [Pseudodesulfovibrio senegalensis]|uniref:CcmD family protein n=1 Tax=Pseudodesulfovibrio senegalensis TaxID=1721087 RepID=A0A6N6N746_9BACT|nr:CcmD family protein [Pseudodesulfovibrio senegalensis]KAB1443265.1 CcmD family protein [Pseudodesulfovibrio senegalensis]